MYVYRYICIRYRRRARLFTLGGMKTFSRLVSFSFFVVIEIIIIVINLRAIITSAYFELESPARSFYTCRTRTFASARER